VTLIVDPTARLSYQLFCGRVERGVPAASSEGPCAGSIDASQTRRPENFLAQDSARGR